MPKKRPTAEQIVTLLRQIEAATSRLPSILDSPIERLVDIERMRKPFGDLAARWVRITGRGA